MEVHMNSRSKPNVTITPVIHNLKKSPKEKFEQKQPDLTFHCMCCEEFFVNPFELYQHINIDHPEITLTEQESDNPKQCSADDDNDYSWVLEPVCELIDLSAEEEDSDESDSDTDYDSSSSSSGSSSSSESSKTSSNAQDLVAGQNEIRSDIGNTMQMEDAIYEEADSNSISSNGVSDFPTLALQMNDTQESTSIILLNSSTNTVIEPIIKGARIPRCSIPGVDEHKKCFQCSHCETSFLNAGDLSKHVRSHITNKPFQCSICEKTFTHIGSLNTHIRIHSGEKPYKCDLCSKAFTQSSSLMVHMRSHSIRKPHQCYLCDKGFVNSSSLGLHLKSHNEIESFSCTECDKQFKQESMLLEHMRMHTHQLVYQCSICRSAFRSSSELVQHMKCHLGEKPFTCSICDRSFTQSGSLNIHMRIHTGEKPFHCKLCDKSFTQASSLGVHMKIHSGEKPFPCNICGKAYSQQSYLNKHVQAHIDADVRVSKSAYMPKEKLMCIVCGSLHNDANSLAQHVTQEHSTLLNNIKNAQEEYHEEDDLMKTAQFGYEGIVDDFSNDYGAEEVVQTVE